MSKPPADPNSWVPARPARAWRSVGGSGRRGAATAAIAAHLQGGGRRAARGAKSCRLRAADRQRGLGVAGRQPGVAAETLGGKRRWQPSPAMYSRCPPRNDPGFVELFDWLGDAEVVLLGEADRAETVLLVGADLCSTRGSCAGTAGRPGTGRRRPYSRWAGCAGPVRECRRPR
jgi:hypothetical protein